MKIDTITIPAALVLAGGTVIVSFIVSIFTLFLNVIPVVQCYIM